MALVADGTTLAGEPRAQECCESDFARGSKAVSWDHSKVPRYHERDAAGAAHLAARRDAVADPAAGDGAGGGHRGGRRPHRDASAARPDGRHVAFKTSR